MHLRKVGDQVALDSLQWVDEQAKVQCHRHIVSYSLQRDGVVPLHTANQILHCARHLRILSSGGRSGGGGGGELGVGKGDTNVFGSDSHQARVACFDTGQQLESFHLLLLS